MVGGEEEDVGSGEVDGYASCEAEAAVIKKGLEVCELAGEKLRVRVDAEEVDGGGEAGQEGLEEGGVLVAWVRD